SKFKDLFETGKLDAKEIEYVFFDQRGNQCSTHFPKDPSLLKYFGSRAIARDMDAIRLDAIGDKRAIIWGQSYGSIAALKYLEEFPLNNNPIVTTGQVGLAKDFLVERYINQGNTLETYFNTYPNDRSRLRRFKSQLNQDHCLPSQMGDVCGKVLADG